jgi:insulysin
MSVLTSPLDDREYSAYTLEENGLRVLLVSDPASLEGGAAMTVRVGATSDPDAIPGLAHFCEHMLFLGTQQYPQEDSFEAFLSSNGGSSNAYTDSERTVYYMDMEIESDAKFGEALQRFGSFFAAPLFTEAATGRELNAIDSEHAKNLQSDSFRFFQLSKARANVNHPFSKFFTGNKQTLLENPVLVTGQKNLRQELLNFYNSYYSSNAMTLAVVGPQPIEALKGMVEKAFASIPNRNVSPPESQWDGLVPPFVGIRPGEADADSESSGRSLIPAFRHAVEVVPVQDLRQVTLTWPLVYMDNVAMDQNASLLAKPSSYVGHLIGHEGPKSLLSYLKKKGWVNSLASGTEDKLSDFETFEVVAGLTPRGLSSLDDVIAAIFTYIYLLRDRTIPPYVLDEVLLLDELGWRYQTKGSVGNYVQSLSTSMQKYPPQLYVAGPRRLALEGVDGVLTRDARLGFPSRDAMEKTRDRVNQYVSSLTVDNVMVTVLSKTFEGQTDAKERWYGTDYRVRPIPSSTLDKWRKGLKPGNLQIDFPRPNPFIPTEAGLRLKRPPPASDALASSQRRSFESRMRPPTPPRVILDDDRWTVHFLEDERFGQPKGYLIFQILTQEAFATPMQAALSNLYEICVSDRLREYAYDGASHCGGVPSLFSCVHADSLTQYVLFFCVGAQPNWPD